MTISLVTPREGMLPCQLRDGLLGVNRHLTSLLAVPEGIAVQLGGAPVSDDAALREELGSDTSKVEKRLWMIVVASVATTLVVVGVYVAQFRGSLSEQPEAWGQFGDYVGGVLNPVLSFLALIALLLTIVLQSRGLRASQKELKNSTTELRNSASALRAQNESLRKQTYETAFFQLLRFHNDIVNGIDIRGHSADASATTLGRDCFKVFFQRFQRAAEKRPADFVAAYNLFFAQHQADLGHYFRHLYHIVRFVHTSGVDDPTRYTSLVRAQLSTYELLLLFYNCVSPQGEEKFKPLVEQYAFLKNVPTNGLLDASHVDLYRPIAFGQE